MKTLVFLLVLANLLFYAFGASPLGQPENPDAARMTQEIRPEKMRIVSRGEAPAAAPATPTAPTPPAASNGPGAAEDGSAPLRPETAPPAPATPVAASTTIPATTTTAVAAKPASRNDTPAQAPAPEAGKTSICLAWKGLDAADADKLTTALESKAGSFRLQRQIVGGEGHTWWVYIPPLPGRAEAEKKAGQLRALGITDYFILQDGNQRNAISLGVFSSEKGGQERLADVKSRGVRSARLAARPGKEGSITLSASGPGSGRAALTATASAALPGVSAQVCP